MLPGKALLRRLAGEAGCSAGGYFSLFLLALCALPLPLCSSAATNYPPWWTNRNIIATVAGTTTNDYAVLTAGQVKWLATNAYDELNAYLPGGAGAGVQALIQSFSSTNNYCGVNVGQVKNLGKPFYDRLIEKGYTNAYPWTSTATDDVDYAAANIGQLKNLFSFDLRIDSDGDDLPNWRETGTGIYIGPYNTGSSATNADTDGDGINDGVEVQNRTDPCNSNTTMPVIAITFPSNNFTRVLIP